MSDNSKDRASDPNSELLELYSRMAKYLRDVVGTDLENPYTNSTPRSHRRTGPLKKTAPKDDQRRLTLSVELHLSPLDLIFLKQVGIKA